MEFETKKQRNNYFRSVNTIINDSPAARPEWAKVPITFTEEDFKLKSANHNDAMVIEVNIARWVIGKILVDKGSSADILFFKTFEKMNPRQHMLYPPEYPLQGFGGKPIKPVGKVSLQVSFGDLDNARTETLTFDVVEIYHPYLAIFGRGFMNKFDAFIRQQFLCMKIPAPKGLSQCSAISRGQKHRKRPYSGPSQCVPTENNRRRKGTLRRGQAGQRKD
jgi:hypothetical protein